MEINRRIFLFLGVAFAAGCAASGGANIASAGHERVVNAGPASQYLADGVYPGYRDLGFFIVRRGSTLFVLSAICTHRKCKLYAETDKSFYCPCHGSRFDQFGNVTEGPARRNLPIFELSTNEKGELLVKISVA